MVFWDRAGILLLLFLSSTLAPQVQRLLLLEGHSYRHTHSQIELQTGLTLNTAHLCDSGIHSPE